MKKIILIVSLITGGFAYTQSQPPKPPSIEERLKKVNEVFAKDLKLSENKQKQVEAAYKDFFAKTDELRKKNPAPPPPPPGKKGDMDKLVKERDEKIEKVLSKTEFEKYKEAEKSLRPPMPPHNKENGKQAPPPQEK